jgi:hypothetical protein
VTYLFENDFFIVHGHNLDTLLHCFLLFSVKLAAGTRRNLKKSCKLSDFVEYVQPVSSSVAYFN